jgi:hypothetical protein
MFLIPFAWNSGQGIAPHVLKALSLLFLFLPALWKNYTNVVELPLLLMLEVVV